MLEEIQRLYLSSLDLPKRRIQLPAGLSSRMKFLTDGRSAFPRKFKNEQPPIFQLYVGWRLCRTLIFYLLSTYWQSTFKGISYSYILTCRKCQQYLITGCLIKIENLRGPFLWNRLVLQTTVARSYLGVTRFSLASSGFKPGPQMLQDYPKALDLTFPKQQGLLSSKLWLEREMMKVDEGRDDVFLALSTCNLSCAN